MTKISANDFQEMRDEYKDVLRSHNYSDNWINIYLNEFDKIIMNQCWDVLSKLMKSIDVQLI